MNIVEILKALADETRVRIINLLYLETLCVCDLEEILQLSQSNASRHVTKLKSAKLLTCEKKAQWVYYRVDIKTLENYSFLNELIAKELANQPQCRKDMARLKKYRERGGGCDHVIKIEDE